MLVVIRQLQRAAYAGTLLAAAYLGKTHVVLTLIGGGVFGNPVAVVWDSILWAWISWRPYSIRTCASYGNTGYHASVIDETRARELAQEDARHPVSDAEIQQIVARQLALITDAHLRDEATRMLIEPQLHDVPWDYGEGGEAFACWVIADLRPGCPFVVAYCGRGFGPGDSFGIIHANMSSMGMDAQWFETLEEGLRSFGFGEAGVAEVCVLENGEVGEQEAYALRGRVA